MASGLLCIGQCSLGPPTAADQEAKLGICDADSTKLFSQHEMCMVPANASSNNEVKPVTGFHQRVEVIARLDMIHYSAQ